MSKTQTGIVVVMTLLALVLLGSWTGMFPVQSLFTSVPEDETASVGVVLEEQNNGLMIFDEVVGSGVEATAGSQVAVHYTGTLADGSVFDSSLTRGTPFTFVLGIGQVIPGWDQGVAGMKVGGKRTLTIPLELAYGEKGFPPVIPPGATLHFTVELLDVQSQ